MVWVSHSYLIYFRSNSNISCSGISTHGKKIRSIPFYFINIGMPLFDNVGIISEFIWNRFERHRFEYVFCVDIMTLVLNFYTCAVGKL